MSELPTMNVSEAVQAIVAELNAKVGGSSKTRADSVEFVPDTGSAHMVIMQIDGDRILAQVEDGPARHYALSLAGIEEAVAWYVAGRATWQARVAR